MATRTISNVGGNYNATTAWVEGIVPTSADDVVATATSGNLTLNVGGSCRSFDMTNYVGTFAMGTQTLTIGTSSAPVSNVALQLVAGMTFTQTAGAKFSFVSTVTGLTIASGGQSVPEYLFTGIGGDWTLTDNHTWPNATNSITFHNGTLHLGTGLTHSGYYLESAVASARTLDPGSSTISLVRNGITSYCFDCTTSTGLTFTANTGTVVVAGTVGSIHLGAGVNTNGLSFVFNGLNGIGQINSTATGASVANLALTPVASGALGVLQIANDMTLTGTLAVQGASASKRILLSGKVLGVAANLTVGSITASVTLNSVAYQTANADFMDIALGTLVDLSATSAGDCGGNSNITFTTPVTRYWVGNGGFWSSTSHWATSSGGTFGATVPLPQDTAILDNNSITSGSQTVTWDVQRLCATYDSTGLTNFNYAPTFNLASGTPSVFGDFKLSPTNNFGSQTFNGTNAIMLQGRGNQVISWNGNFILPPITLNTTGTYSQGSNLQITSGNSGLFTLTAGTWDMNGFNLTMAWSMVVNSNTLTKVLHQRGGNIVFGDGVSSHPGSTVMNMTSLGFTYDWNIGAQIIFTIGTAATNFTFAGSNLSYPDVYYNVSTGLTMTITGANTFRSLNVSPGNPVVFPASTTQTFTNGFNLVGQNYGYQYLLAKSGQYVSVPDSVALSLSSDFTLDVECSLPNWIPATENDLLAKWTSTGSQASYVFALTTTGKLRLYISASGSSSTGVLQATSSAATGFSANAVSWLRVTWRKSDGLTQFFTSPNDVTYTQLGTNQTLAQTAIFDSTAQLTFGGESSGTASLFKGNLYRSRIYSDVTQTTKVFDADFTTKPFGANSFTESSANAATVTINGVNAQAGDGRISLASSSPATQYTLALPSPTGLTKQTNIPLAGVSSFVGSLGGRAIGHVLAASLSFSGSLKRAARRTLTAASLSFSGTLTSLHRHFLTLTATLNRSGQITKALARSLTATSQKIGSLTKSGTRLLGGTLSSSGTLRSHISQKLLTATLQTAGQLIKATHRVFTAALTLQAFFKVFITPKWTYGPPTTLNSQSNSDIVESSDNTSTLNDPANRVTLDSDNNDVTLE